MLNNVYIKVDRSLYILRLKILLQCATSDIYPILKLYVTYTDADLVVDSGVETIASQSTTSKFKTSFAEDVPLKKSVSIALSDLS